MTDPAPPRRPFRLLSGLLLAAAVAALLAVILYDRPDVGAPPEVQAAQEVDVPELDARRAFQYLVDICELGPRVSGTQGMQAQQELLARHFQEHGGQVRFQSFDAPHPVTGNPVRLNNMIVQWHPEAQQRVLLACHYDTRPYPDRDPVNPRGRFLGANDGASGVALFMELAHHMDRIEPTYGVDFVLFDAEELVYQPQDEYFLGSSHFSEQYRDKPPGHTYVAGVLVDMIADKRLSLPMERNSRSMAPQVTDSVWKAAAEVGVREFVRRLGPQVNDDHIPLNTIAKIPTCDIIDFSYPHWHTMQDVPANCSGHSIAKVGRVLMHWLQNVPDFAADR